MDQEQKWIRAIQRRGSRRAAEELVKAGGLVSASELVPSYHRLSQAERERLAQNKEL